MSVVYIKILFPTIRKQLAARQTRLVQHENSTASSEQQSTTVVQQRIIAVPQRITAVPQRITAVPLRRRVFFFDKKLQSAHFI